MKTGIYMIRNKVNDKKYIGQAVDIDKRWGEHIKELNGNKHYNRYLQRAWNKYGKDNFEFTIICQCLEQDLDRLEIHYIAHFDTHNNGYNLTLGGDGTRGYKFTEDQLAYRHSDEHRKILSEARKEYFKDPENRKKTGEVMKKALNRPEVKAKMSEAMKGKPLSEKTKAKISESMKGKNAGPKSEEWKAKRNKKVYCITNDIVYASVIEAGEKLGIDPSCIGWCCNGKNINKRYPDGHHYKKGCKKDSPVYEFWFLSEYEEKFGKVAD